jgi:hypothetical protein
VSFLDGDSLPFSPTQHGQATNGALNEIRDELGALGAATVIAADVVVTPSGQLASTDAQAALVEHQADLDALDARVDALEASGGGASLDGPHVVGSGGGEPAFTGNWQAMPAGWEPLAFSKDSLGFVDVIGVVRNLTPGDHFSAIFTLPVGFRPANQVYGISYAGFTDGVANDIKSVRVDVLSTGVVQTVIATEAAPAALKWVSNIGLHLRFRAA